MRNPIALALFTLALVACGDPETPADLPDARAGDDAAAGPSTDPAHPTPLTAGVTVAATYTTSEHYFVFTAPGAGDYTLHLTGPGFAQVASCAATGGCLCDITPGSHECCQIQETGDACQFDARQVDDLPLAAGAVIYPTVYMRPGVGGPYTLTLTGPS